jgi:hypothetical protein
VIESIQRSPETLSFGPNLIGSIPFTSLDRVTAGKTMVISSSSISPEYECDTRTRRKKTQKIFGFKARSIIYTSSFVGFMDLQPASHSINLLKLHDIDIYGYTAIGTVSSESYVETFGAGGHRPRGGI